jgi:hypothetical protein
MQLWPLDVMCSVPLADGSKGEPHLPHRRPLPVLLDRHGGAPGHHRPGGMCRLRQGVDRVYGIPEQVFDRQRQVVHRQIRPTPPQISQVLFERICRNNGIEPLLTKPRSPTISRREAIPDTPCGAGSTDRCDLVDPARHPAV